MKAISYCALLLLILVVVGLLYRKNVATTTYGGLTSIVCGNSSTAGVYVPPSASIDVVPEKTIEIFETNNKEDLMRFAAAISNDVYCVHHFDGQWNSMITDKYFQENDYPLENLTLLDSQVFYFDSEIVPDTPWLFSIVGDRSYLFSTPGQLKVVGSNGHGNDDQFAGLFVVGYSTKFNKIVIGFRGTKNEFDQELHVSLNNWIRANAEFTQENIHGVGVHRGFLHMYIAAGHKLNESERLTMLLDKYPTADLLVTGHSLGAGQATIAAFDIAQYPRINQEMRNVSLITFGSPRVGSPQFVSKFVNTPGLSNIRVVNQEDMVTVLPFRKMPTWTHIKTVLFERWAGIEPAPALITESLKNKLFINPPKGMYNEYLHIPQEHWYKERYPNKPILAKDSQYYEDDNGRFSEISNNEYTFILSSLGEHYFPERFKGVSAKITSHQYYMGFELGPKCYKTKNEVSLEECNKSCDWYPSSDNTGWNYVNCKNREMTNECNRLHIIESPHLPDFSDLDI